MVVKEGHFIRFSSDRDYQQSWGTRPIEPGAAHTIIKILMLGQQRPPVVRNVVLERAPLTLDGACVLLLTGRDTCIECDFHSCPPGVPE